MKEDRPDELTVLRRALAEMKQMRAKIESLERAGAEPIAILGMGCRFPGGAGGPDEFWRLLHDGVDAIREVPPDRWNVDDYFDPDPDTPGKSYTRAGGFLENVDLFDAGFFRITPREAASIDPQQRLLLETSWEALERAGLAANGMEGSRTGVFIGITTNDYLHLQIGRVDPGSFDAYTATGNPLNFAAGRLSYFFGFQGPCMAVDAACASSLVSVHLACQSLRARECNAALAGGVNIVLSPQGSVFLSKTRALAPDGRCKTFDAGADGMSRGEGCGIIVLKRLSDAVRDRDRILAVIRGSAVGQDGSSSGLTVPNGQAQQALIRQALANAGVKPWEVSYVEAHGTGTSLGDPIEVRSLAAVLSEGRQPGNSFAIGSVKTNIGHLEAAAGVAGLIKTVLALRHEEIPPHLHLKNLTPHVAWDRIPVVIPTEPAPWPRGSQRRIAGVSAFGLSGIISHLILEEAPEVAPAAAGPERPLHLLTLSAKEEQALSQLAERYEQRLGDGGESFADVCYTANTGRAHFRHRLAVLAESAGQAQAALAAIGRREPGRRCFAGQVEPGAEPKLAFLFSGQGSQYVGMGRTLYETQPLFRETLTRCERMLEGYLDRPLLAVLYPAEGALSPLDDTAYTQPALFALEYALAELWRSWGVEPRVVLGHSVGEYVAACVAGIFTLEEGIRLVAERGRLMQELPAPGAMAAVFASETEVRRRLRGYEKEVAVAAVNGPDNTVISGEQERIEELTSRLQDSGIPSRRLRVSQGFHSPLMEAMLPAFERAAEKVRYGKAQLTVVTNLTGRAAMAGEMENAGYWVRQLRETVRFREAMETVREQGCGVMVEVGPKPTLLGLGQQCLGTEAAVWLGSLREGRNDWEEILNSVARLYLAGMQLDWQGFDRGYPRRRVSLPTYPFQRKRFWFDAAGSRSSPTRDRAESPKPAQAQSPDWLYQVSWHDKPIIEPSSGSTLPGRWLVLGDRQGVGEKLAAGLQENGHISLLLMAEPDAPAGRERFQNTLRDVLTNPDTPCRGIVHLLALDEATGENATAASLEAAQRVCCATALEVAQAAAVREGPASPRLWFVTRGAQSAGPTPRPPAIGQSPLWGLGKVLALEHPGLWGGLIDLEPGGATEEDAWLLRELESPDGETQVAFREGRRYVARLTRLPDAPPATTGFVLRDDATYLITGGLGGVGLNLAHWMAKRGARHLILIGRSGPSSHALEVITELEHTGVSVLTVRANVSRIDEVASALRHAGTSMPALRGVIHAAGVLADGVLLQQDWPRFESVMAPKIAGGWNLHSATLGCDLDFFVLFSSASALFGAPAQGNYAAANAFLDALAEFRRAKGFPATSVNWGPWAGAGMAAGAVSTRSWDLAGIGSIPPALGTEILERLVQRDVARAAVLPVNWDRFVGRRPDRGLALFVSEVAGEVLHPAGGAEAGRNLAEELKRAASADRPGLVAAYLHRRLQSILGVEAEGIASNRSLIDTGIDSLMVMELLKALRSDLGITVYPREFYERPTIDALARYLAAEVETNSSGAGSAATPAVPVPGLRAPEKRIPGIVFLLSSPRAGSTLLRVMMAGHPKLFCPPELHLLPFNTMTERRDTLAAGYLGEGLQRAFMELNGFNAEDGKSFVDDLSRRDLPIQSVYAMLQEQASGRLLVDKSPSYAISPATLAHAEALFDGPKYIHLIRHPYAVIESFVRNRLQRLIPTGNADPHDLAEQVWTTSNRNTLRFVEGVDPGRRHRIRYEEMVADPEPVLLRLCQFLQIPFDDALLKPYEGPRMTDGVHAQSLSIGDPGFLDHSMIEPALGEAWKSIRLPRRLGGSTRQIATELEYSLPAEESHRPPAVANFAAGDTAMRERYVEVRGLNLCLCEWGPPDAAPVLCLHGILDQGAAWEPVAVELAQRGMRVIAPDLRGHGRSGHVGDGSSYHVLDFLGDLDALTRELRQRPLALVGHSMGAALSAMFAGARPRAIDSLVLIECPFPSGGTPGEAPDRMATQLDCLSARAGHTVLSDVTAAAQRLRQATAPLPDDLVLRLARRITEPCEGGVRWRWDARIQTRVGITFHGIDGLNPQDYLEMAGRIEAPVTLVYAASSNFVKPDRMAAMEAAFACAKRVLLPGGHNLHLEAPGAIADIIALAATQP